MRKIRVRIPVIVHPNGEWASPKLEPWQTKNMNSIDELGADLAQYDSSGGRVYFVEATVEVPEKQPLQTVEGEIG